MNMVFYLNSKIYIPAPFLDDFGVAFSVSASDADELGEVLFLLTDVCLGFGADVLVPVTTETEMNTTI